MFSWGFTCWMTNNPSDATHVGQKVRYFHWSVKIYFIFIITIYSTFTFSILSYKSFFCVNVFYVPLNGLYLDLWRYTNVLIIIIIIEHFTFPSLHSCRLISRSRRAHNALRFGPTAHSRLARSRVLTTAVAWNAAMSCDSSNRCFAFFSPFSLGFSVEGAVSTLTSGPEIGDIQSENA